MSKVFLAIDATNRKNNLEALEVLKKSGIQFIKPSVEDYKQWQQLADKANTKLVTSGSLDKKLKKKVEQLLKEYRQKILVNKTNLK